MFGSSLFGNTITGSISEVGKILVVAAGVGGAIASGEADVKFARAYEGQGGAVAAGAAQVSLARAYQGTGGAVASGSAQALFGRVYTGSGGAVAAGSAETAFGRVYEGSGGAVASGRAYVGKVYNLKWETGGPDFRPGDLLLARRLDYDKNAAQFKTMEVNGVVQSIDADGEANVEVVAGSQFLPSFGLGIEFVRIGNKTDTNRQGGLYLTSDDSNSPFLDVYDGIDEFSKLGALSTTKVRLGKLSGITDPNFGPLSGYGLFTENAYLKGTLAGGSASALMTGAGYRFHPDGSGRLGNPGTNKYIKFDAAEGEIIFGSAVTLQWAQVAGAGKPSDNADVTLSALNGELSLTGGGLVLAAASNAKFRSGQTAYDTGTGFWLGDVAGTPKFSVGNSAGNKLTWNGTTLNIVGTIGLGSSVQWADVTGAGKPSDNADVTLSALNGELSLTGGGLVLATASNAKIRSGQTAFDNGTGFWLGDVAGTPKFSIGNSASKKMTWDGSELTATGMTVKSGASGQRIEINSSDNTLRFFNSTSEVLTLGTNFNFGLGSGLDGINMPGSNSGIQVGPYGNGLIIDPVHSAHAFGKYTSYQISNNETVVGYVDYFTIARANGDVPFEITESPSRITIRKQLYSTIAPGTPPFVISSTTVCTNLNANLLEGQHASAFEPANANIQAHIASASNPHSVTKTQVGLGSVENTALSTWAGSSNITTVGALTAGALSTGFTAVNVALGGTGLTSMIAAGAMLYSTSAAALATLSIAAAGSVLTSNGTAPQWTAGYPASAFGSLTAFSPNALYLVDSGLNPTQEVKKRTFTVNGVTVTFLVTD